MERIRNFDEVKTFFPTRISKTLNWNSITMRRCVSSLVTATDGNVLRNNTARDDFYLDTREVFRFNWLSWVFFCLMERLHVEDV